MPQQHSNHHAPSQSLFFILRADPLIPGTETLRVVRYLHHEPRLVFFGRLRLIFADLRFRPSSLKLVKKDDYLFDCTQDIGYTYTHAS